MKKLLIALIFFVLISPPAHAWICKNCTLQSAWLGAPVTEAVLFCTGSELNQSWKVTKWDNMQVYALSTVHKDGAAYELIMEISGISSIVNFRVEEYSFNGISQSITGKVVNRNEVIPDFTITVGETTSWPNR